MSSDHGRLIRTATGWRLLDPSSKNGSAIDGTNTREGSVEDDALVELGHTFLVFRVDHVAVGLGNDASEPELDAVHPALATFDGSLVERFAALAKLAPSEVSILVHGETGTGKEVITRAIHALSRRSGAMVAVNCGALPATLIEAELFGYRRGAFTGAVSDRVGFVRSADNGTLFLDEIGDLPLSSQAALLRVLQEQEVVPVGGDRAVKVDVRVCAATLRDLERLVEAGAFRADLFARLYGFTIVLPPLRDRIVDLGLLLRRVLADVPNGVGTTIEPAALRAFLQHDWPLNIRELDKVVRTAVALSNGMIELAHLPPALVANKRVPPPAREVSTPELIEQDARRARIVELLVKHHGNVVAVAKELGARRTQVYRWLNRYDLDPDSFRG